MAFCHKRDDAVVHRRPKDKPAAETATTDIMQRQRLGKMPALCERMNQSLRVNKTTASSNARLFS